MVFGVIAHWTEVVVLVVPLKEFRAAAEVAGGVFGDSALLRWGKGMDGRCEGWPIDCGIGRIVPFLGPIFGDGWLRDEVVDPSFVELSLFVRSEI